ncbi:MAG: BatA domain-containing protein, partial [Phycisphaeraceae bacterium]|nr:BatA domain-containing protein [Phycisphaeraceae bacterium]
MTFLNLAITGFLASVLIPILIHLFNRRSAKVVEWGAMQFLTGSLVSRKRKILLEEMLLLSLRCLLLALLVLALARPFFEAGSGLAWAIALPAVLLGTVALAVGTAFWQYGKWRNIFWTVGTTLLLVACGAIFLQRWYNPDGRQAVAERDVVIIIDGSTSMKLQTVDDNRPEAPKKSNFRRAVEEAKQIIARLDQAAATSIILAGPTPNPRTLNPIYDRKELNDILDSLKPTDGRMNVHDAIKAAALVLANGHNPHKQIIVLTDEQNAGWEPQNEPAWQYVEDMLGRFPLKPSVYARFYEHPEDYNNIAVTRAEPGRSIVGTDRPLAFDVHLENTGKGPTSPGALQLWVDGKKVQELPLKLLQSGGADSLRLTHRFKTTGSHVVQVVAAVNDHLPADNKATRVVYVMEKLPVLLVDGNPDPDPWHSSAQFMRVALAPGMQEANPAQQDFLVDAKLIDASQIVSITDFSGYSAVVLANVPRLPASVARALGQYVRHGGGVLIT